MFVGTVQLALLSLLAPEMSFPPKKLQAHHLLQSSSGFFPWSFDASAFQSHRTIAPRISTCHSVRFPQPCLFDHHPHQNHFNLQNIKKNNVARPLAQLQLQPDVSSQLPTTRASCNSSNSNLQGPAPPSALGRAEVSQPRPRQSAGCSCTRKGQRLNNCTLEVKVGSFKMTSFGKKELEPNSLGKKLEVKMLILLKLECCQGAHPPHFAWSSW